MKLALLILLIQLLIFADGGGEQQNTYNSSNVQETVFEYSFVSDKKMQVGEELTYVVSYTMIKLGEVKIRIRDKKEFNGRTIYNTVGYINSYPGVPLVDLHQIYESKVKDDISSAYFRGIVKHPEYSTFTEYKFDNSGTKIRVKKGKVNPHQLWTDSVAVVKNPIQDGLSILFFARTGFGKNRSVNVPCFVNEKVENTKINFYTDVQEVEIDAVDYPISCLRLDGNTDFVSVFGLTGYFEGWFSNDDASVPIVAKMKVIIGNVKLELKEWKREGWIPPKY